MTYVHGFFGNYRIALSETTSNPVVKQKTFNKRKHIHTQKKQMIKKWQINQMQERESTLNTAKRAELSKLPKHAKLYQNLAQLTTSLINK